MHTAERIIDASRVVLAGGAGTPALARMLGVTQLNLQAVPIQIAVTEPVQARPVGEFHQRHEAGARHEVGLIERREAYGQSVR